MFQGNVFTKEVDMVQLFAYVDIGGTGAPTLNVSKSKGVASIAHNSAGNYTVTLSDVYAAHMFTNMMLLSSTSRDLTFQLLAVDAAAKTIQFVVHAVASATNPTSGDVVLLDIVMKQSGA